MWARAIERGCPDERPHVVIPDAVDVDTLQPPDRSGLHALSAERPLRLLSVGRLHWKKGHEIALAAVAQLRQRGVEIEYRIVGDGEHREPTEFAVADLGLGEYVQLLGALDATAVREQLAWADVLVHPSLTEAFGVAVAEAQAMGLPVVCTDVGGLPENIEHGVTGFAVPRRDPSALAAALKTLAEDTALRLRMGQAARRRAEQELDHRVQLDRFEAVYRDLLERRDTAVEQLPVRAARASRRREHLREMRARLALGGDQPGLEENVWRHEVVELVQHYVEAELPVGARVLVVSRGDEDIIDFAGRHGEHFPQAPDGRYAGHHPADSEEAIVHLTSLCEAGAEFLVIPGTAHWWLDHYEAFARHLDQHYQRTAVLDRGYIAFALVESGQERAA
jgi:hypothetical protein